MEKVTASFTELLNILNVQKVLLLISKQKSYEYEIEKASTNVEHCINNNIENSCATLQTRCPHTVTSDLFDSGCENVTGGVISLAREEKLRLGLGSLRR